MDYKLTQYKGMLYQNLGSLQAIQENHEKAIEYYTLSLSYKEGPQQVEGYMITTLSIVKEYSKQNDHQRVLSWCEAGFSKMDEASIQQKSNIKSYIHHFHIYQALHNHSEEFEAIVKKVLIILKKSMTIDMFKSTLFFWRTTTIGIADLKQRTFIIKRRMKYCLEKIYYKMGGFIK